jgi:hypothetical protein
LGGKRDIRAMKVRRCFGGKPFHPYNCCFPGIEALFCIHFGDYRSKSDHLQIKQFFRDTAIPDPDSRCHFGAIVSAFSMSSSASAKPSASTVLRLRIVHCVWVSWPGAKTFPCSAIFCAAVMVTALPHRHSISPRRDIDGDADMAVVVRFGYRSPAPVCSCSVPASS